MAWQILFTIPFAADNANAARKNVIQGCAIIHIIRFFPPTKIAVPEQLAQNSSKAPRGALLTFG